MRTTELWALALLALGACRRSPPDTATDDSSSPVDDSAGDDSATDDTAAGQDGVPVAMVADGGNQRYVYIRLDTGEIIYEIPLREAFPQYCVEGFDCVAFGSEPLVDDATGEDRALLIAAVSQFVGTDVPEVPAFVAMTRPQADGLQVDWVLDSLDFTQNYGDRPDICDQSVACRAPNPDDVGNTEWRKCTFQNTHTAAIIEETADSVTMWVADTGKPARALKVRLDTSQTCGVVEQVLGPETNTDWTDESGPNDLDLVDVDGEDRLLMNHLASAGYEAQGRVTMWEPVGDDWRVAWKHPVDGSRLQGGHEADLIQGDDGLSYVVYAHGNGAGASDDINSWDGEQDHRGTVGIVRIVDDQPVYLLDGTTSDPRFSFLRDADFLDDGSFLVTDSGCMNPYFPGCEREAGLWHVDVDFENAAASGKTGAFSADHSQQEFVPVSLVDAPFPHWTSCGLLTPYEADFRWDSQLGSFLRSQVDAPLRSCDE